MKKSRYLLQFTIVSVILTAVAMGVVPLPQFVMAAEADGGDKTVTGLGTGAIRNPRVPKDETDEWQGSYVYFGKYDANGDGTAEPVRYRVLDKASSDFGVEGRSLLLDCDTMLYNAQFHPEEFHNIWEESEVRKGLNEGENSFLGKPGNFTDAEKSAIAESKKSAPAPGDGVDDVSDYFSFAPLTGEKVFLLDPVEVVRASYGYNDSDGKSWNRLKSNQGGWWLRSPYDIDYKDLHFRYAGFVDNEEYSYDVYVIYEGTVTSGEVTHSFGVSPALNVKLSSVLFSSLVPSSPSGAGEAGAEYKLTLMRSGLSADVGAVTREGDVVTILFAVDPLAGPEQVSVVVTKDPWATWDGLNHDAGLLQYAKLNAQWDENGIGTGTFTLDTSKASGTWGKDYHVYILAEDVNGERETDYAGTPHEVESPISVAVNGYEGTYDGQAHGIAVTADYHYDYKIKYKKPGETEYQDECPVYTDAADSPYTVDYQVIVLIDRLAAEGSATVTIHQAPLVVKAKDHQMTYGDEPSNEGVTYTGFVNGETESVLQGTLAYDYSYNPYDDVGDGYTITPKGLTSRNYEIQYAPGILTVGQRPITVSGIAVRDRPYDGTTLADLDYRNAVLQGRLVADNVSVSATGTYRDPDVGVGKTVDITDMTLEGSRAHNYILSDECQRTATGAIERADQIVAQPTAKLGLSYTGQPLELITPGSAQGGTLIYAVTIAETVPTDYTASIPAVVNAGTYRVWYKAVGDKNHNDFGPYWVAASILSAKVEPKPPTGEALTYNGADQPLVKAGTVEGGTLLYAIGVDGRTAPTEGWSETVPARKDAGPYYVWYMVKGDANHHDTIPAVVEVSIVPRQLVVTAEAKAKTYGEADPELTWTQQGLVEGDALTVALKRAGGENVGSYTITFDRYEVSENYEKGFNEATLAIDARGATVTARDQTVTEGEAIRGDVSMAKLSGPAKGDTLSAVTLTAGKRKIIPSGAKIASAAGVDVTGNYNITYVAGKLTVKPKPTAKPTRTPTPSARPTARPTRTPTPSAKPTAGPTRTPTPSVRPTAGPTRTPTPTAKPTAGPTAAPTVKPVPRPVAPDFTLLARMTAPDTNMRALKVAWTKVRNADGYDVYFARRGYRFRRKRTVWASQPRAVWFRGLYRHERYKAYVRAWKMVNGRKVRIGAASPKVYAIAGGYDAEYCNTKSVTLNHSRLFLKIGGARTLRAAVKGVKRGKTVLQHVRKTRFYSTNANVATVDKYGKVMGVGEGTCTIYAIANNGVRSSVKVTVKSAPVSRHWGMFPDGQPTVGLYHG